MELPAIQAEGLLDDEERVWEPPVQNLDSFFAGMYHYYNQKGLPTILLSEFCGLFTLIFTSIFSILLIGFVDWFGLRECRDEKTCAHLLNYLRASFFQYSLLWKLFLILYTFILALFCLWQTYRTIHIVQRAAVMEKFYRDKLGIYGQELQTLPWHQVLHRLILLHNSGLHRVAVKDRLTAHDVSLRILRKENYLIAFINKRILTLNLPWWLSPLGSDRLFLTKSLEWSVSFCTLEHMFNDQFQISKLFLNDVQGLKGRFVILGIAHLLLLPFMLIFMTISFFLQNAQLFHSSRTYLGPRQWSPLALWIFREFNELPHLFEERMRKSYTPANEYMSHFHDSGVVILARCGAYIAGSFVAVLLLLSFLSEGALLFVTVADHNLLWWLGVLTGAFAAARSLIPDDTRSKENADELMNRIAACTHHFPPHWVDRAHTVTVRDELAYLFPFKASLFVMEILSALLTPIVLCFSLPNCAETVIDFVRDHSRYVDGVGAVCDYSLFDFERHGDARFGAPITGYEDQTHRPENGKLEQSYLNFQQANPDWRGAPGGRELVDRLSVFKAMKEEERERAVGTLLEQSIERSHGVNGLHGSFLSSKGPANMRTSLVVAEQHIEASSPVRHFLVESSGESVLDHIGEDKGAFGDREFHQDSLAGASGRDVKISEEGKAKAKVTPMEAEVDANSDIGYSEYTGSVHHSLINQQSDFPSILRSILRNENIDYENDFYWMNKFCQERIRNPGRMEQSFSQMRTSSLNLAPISGLQSGSVASGFGYSNVGFSSGDSSAKGASYVLDQNPLLALRSSTRVMGHGAMMDSRHNNIIAANPMPANRSSLQPPRTYAGHPGPVARSGYFSGRAPAPNILYAPRPPIMTDSASGSVSVRPAAMTPSTPPFIVHNAPLRPDLALPSPLVERGSVNQSFSTVPVAPTHSLLIPGASSAIHHMQSPAATVRTDRSEDLWRKPSPPDI